MGIEWNYISKLFYLFSFFSGYSMYLARNIPFSFIQYHIYYLVTEVFKKKENKEEDVIKIDNQEN